MKDWLAPASELYVILLCLTGPLETHKRIGWLLVADCGGDANRRMARIVSQ